MQWSSFPLLFNLNVRKREEKAAHLALCLRTPANLGGFSRVCQETHQKVVSEGGANRLCCCYRFALWHHKRLIFICSIFWTACMSTLSLQGWASEKEQKSSLPCSRYGLKKKKDRKTWILHYMGPFTCSCFYPAGASLCGVNISTPCLCKCPEGAEDTQVGSTGDHTASSHECQCECTCYMCVTHVTGSKHVHAWHPVHAGKHSNPFRSPLAHQKMDGRSDQCQIPCACVVDGALMALKSNRF